MRLILNDEYNTKLEKDISQKKINWRKISFFSKAKEYLIFFLGKYLVYLMVCTLNKNLSYDLKRTKIHVFVQAFGTCFIRSH